MLIPFVEGKIRQQIVYARVQAMQSGCSSGIALLRDDPSLHIASRVAIAMQRCEILFLDQQNDDACKVYDTMIEPLLEKLSPECASILIDNRSTLAFASFNAEGSDQFYHQVDIRKLLGIELSDSRAEWEAERSAFAGKHYEALPAIWKILLVAYQKQNWRALYRAHAHMAKECMALNWSDEAVWHAVQALDKDLVIETANHLASSKEQNRIMIGIDRLLIYSKLAKHADLTAIFLNTITDCIPNDRVTKVMEWVSPYIEIVPSSWASASNFESIWKLVGSLGCRISPDLALIVSKKAINHGAIEYKNTVRKHLINSLYNLFEVMDSQELEQFVNPVLSLVTSLKSDFDYRESLNLVCQLAEKRVSCRETLKATLFPPGVAVSNPFLLEAASFLGWHPEEIDKLNDNAIEVALALRKQVEILGANSEPSKLGGFGQVTSIIGIERTVVHIGGAQNWLDAIASHLGCLNDNSILQLVDSILEMIACNSNIVSNRISLIRTLGLFIPRLSSDLANRVSQILSCIAHGDFSESEIGQTHEETINPLNAFKMNLGDPHALQGIALLTLARGSREHPVFSTELHSGLLQYLLEIDNQTLRRYAVVSAQHADRLSEIEITALIASGLDGTSDVRKLVLHGLASVMSISFDQLSLRLGLRIIRIASVSADAEERAEAARAAKALLKYVTDNNEIKEQLSTTLKLLSDDISYYVRKCAAN
jgi:hypothetical protein